MWFLRCEFLGGGFLMEFSPIMEPYLGGMSWIIAHVESARRSTKV
jgi:hypothetical protein